ncbi:MAG: HNH endonuclease, partial [Clostridia bacterium]
RNWRRNIFNRDDYTCKICGVRGGYIEAHHIVPWSKEPLLRYSLDNGVTLCKKCHRELHKKERLPK